MAQYLLPKSKFINVLFLMIFWSQNLKSVLAGEKLALLSATLRTYHKAGCDTDQVIISCPRGTSISVEFAQYNKFNAKDGISIEELCSTPHSDNKDIRDKLKHLLRGSFFGFSGQTESMNTTSSNLTNSSNDTTTNLNGTIQSTELREEVSRENCMWPNALQYSLLQTVVEACQKKMRCKFHASPQYYGLGVSGVGDTSGSSSYHSSAVNSKAISVDPCPKKRKLVAVAYKCRPYEFRSKVACHNDLAQLECNPYSRIAIYSASFGRTEYESIQCPQPQGVREETCLAIYATETVMHICHGRRRCNLAADSNTFGTPCRPNSKMYLKVVYACVPKQVLKENNDSHVEPDETENFEKEYYDEDEGIVYKESEAIPKLYGNLSDKTYLKYNTSSTGHLANRSGLNETLSTSVVSSHSKVNPVITHSADRSSSENLDQLYLYLLTIAGLGVICSTLFVVSRLLIHKYFLSPTTGSPSTTKENTPDSLEVDDRGCETTTQSGNKNDTEAIPIPIRSEMKTENYINVNAISHPSGSMDQERFSISSKNPTCNSLYEITTVPEPITNKFMKRKGPSPDIVGTPSNTFKATLGSVSVSEEATLSDVFTPTILINANNNEFNNCNSVPLNPLTIRTGYYINSETTFQNPLKILTPPKTSILSIKTPLQSQAYIQPSLALPLPSQLQSQPQYDQECHQSEMSTIGNLNSFNMTQRLPLQGIHEDVTSRTHSTGLATNSHFYYG